MSLLLEVFSEETPTITHITAALYFALFCHLKDLYAKLITELSQVNIHSSSD